jgi:hypothetical protein
MGCMQERARADSQQALAIAQAKEEAIRKARVRFPVLCQAHRHPPCPVGINAYLDALLPCKLSLERLPLLGIMRQGEVGGFCIP